jgi:hypothetical protein
MLCSKDPLACDRLHATSSAAHHMALSVRLSAVIASTSILPPYPSMPSTPLTPSVSHPQPRSSTPPPLPPLIRRLRLCLRCHLPLRYHHQPLTAKAAPPSPCHCPAPPPIIASLSRAPSMTGVAAVAAHPNSPLPLIQLSSLGRPNPNVG